MEVKRQMDVLNGHLADNEYMAGAEYTIADMAICPWYGRLAAKDAYNDAGDFLSVDEYEHVQRWTSQVGDRSAVKRGAMVNSTSGDPSTQLQERHDAADFETKTQDKIGKG